MPETSNCESADSGQDLWIFGYGSLIWRPDFEYLEKRPAVLAGWSRRFWQGSHDHRGTPEAPGRVVTLIPDAESACEGMAFRLADSARERVLQLLDYREKNGYERLYSKLVLDDGRSVDGLTYIADEENPAFLGPAPLAEIAKQIATSVGPSGQNSDYLLELAKAFRELSIEDEHIYSLERLLLRHL